MPAKKDSAALQALHAWSSDEWLRFLGGKRWFAAKGASPTRASVLDAVVVPWGNGDFAIARVAMESANGSFLFQVPFSARGEPDAMADDEFRRGLVQALTKGAVGEDDAVRWIAEPVQPIELPEATRVGSAEQSNTSIIVGDRAIVKLFRLLKDGVHPDVEITRFLTTRAGFTQTPHLIAEARFDGKGGKDAMASAMMQEYLPGSTDAWAYALERGRPYFAAARDKDPTNAFIEDARALGATTRALHEALASDDEHPDFCPEPILPEDLDRWALRTQQSIRDALALLDAQIATPAFPKERVAEAQALVRRRDHYIGWVNEIDDSLGDDVGMRIRIHGDYHLGQVLRAKSGEFMIIDFEGEPSKPIAERREKSSPLRDVAGMLRSFAYAAATLAAEAGRSIDVPTRELRAARWERDVRAAYLAGYLAPVDEDAGEFLPEDERHVRQLIALFETEKAFYELAYELNNRPAWVGIPLRGISKLAVR